MLPFKIKKARQLPTFPHDLQYHRRNESLTSVFGMGTGITSPLWQPGNKKRNKKRNLLNKGKRFIIDKRQERK